MIKYGLINRSTRRVITLRTTLIVFGTLIIGCLSLGCSQITGNELLGHVVIEEDMTSLYGLYVGQEKTAALSVVEALPRNQRQKLRMNLLSEDGLNSQLLWFDNFRGTSVSVTVENNLVSSISMKIDAHSVSLTETLDWFGAPTAYAAFLDGGELETFIVYVIYPDTGIVVEANWILRHEVLVADCLLDVSRPFVVNAIHVLGSAEIDSIVNSIPYLPAYLYGQWTPVSGELQDIELLECP